MIISQKILQRKKELRMQVSKLNYFKDVIELLIKKVSLA